MNGSHGFKCQIGKLWEKKNQENQENGENDMWHGESGGKFTPLLINMGDEKKRKRK